jgi:enoyl-CoA hydratase/carnithine racemase
VIDLDFADGVAWLTLARPEALNALDTRMTEALADAVEQVAARDDVGVVVVTGRGRAFCAGNDITEMTRLTPQDAEALTTRQGRLMERFGELPQVTLAAVDGHALGGGLMLAIAQDLRLASDRARFGLPEVTLGFNPGYGIARLLDVVGGGHGRDLLLTGRTIRSADALRMGLVNRVVAAPTLEATARQWAAEIAALPRAGVAAAKRCVAAVRRGAPGGEPAAYAATLGTPAARARVAEFVARKSPRPAR